MKILFEPKVAKLYYHWKKMSLTTCMCSREWRILLLRTVLGYCRHAWPIFSKDPKLVVRTEKGTLLFILKPPTIGWSRWAKLSGHACISFSQLFPRTELYFSILASGLSSSQSSTLLLLPAGDRWRRAEIKLPATDQNISYYWTWPIIFRSQRL